MKPTFCVTLVSKHQMLSPVKRRVLHTNNTCVVSVVDSICCWEVRLVHSSYCHGHLRVHTAMPQPKCKVFGKKTGWKSLTWSIVARYSRTEKVTTVIARCWEIERFEFWWLRCAKKGRHKSFRSKIHSSSTTTRRHGYVFPLCAMRSRSMGGVSLVVSFVTGLEYYL